MEWSPAGAIVSIVLHWKRERKNLLLVVKRWCARVDQRTDAAASNGRRKKNKSRWKMMMIREKSQCSTPRGPFLFWMEGDFFFFSFKKKNKKENKHYCQACSNHDAWITRTYKASWRCWALFFFSSSFSFLRHQTAAATAHKRWGSYATARGLSCPFASAASDSAVNLLWNGPHPHNDNNSAKRKK